MKIITTLALLLFSVLMNAQPQFWWIGDKIQSMTMEDMMIRMKVDSVFKKYGKDSPEWKSAWKKLEESDSVHNSEIKKIIAELKVYPGNNLVGPDAAHCFWTLVLHQDKDTALQRKVIELMKPEIETNNIEVNDYAYLVDRHKINTGMKQVYGTQCYYDPKKKAYVPRPIEDRENVDKRRKEMDLPPLADYLKILNDPSAKSKVR